MRILQSGLLFGLAAVVRGQGSLGNPQTSCSSAQAWVYQGCYSDLQNGFHLGFTFALSPAQGSPQGYPTFVTPTGGPTNQNMTVDICLQACRGHGFQYAALHVQTECWCATQFPNPGPGDTAPAGTQPGTPTGDSSTNNATAPNTCHETPQSLFGCHGNLNEWCGSGVASDLYKDPSYSITSGSGAASNYVYVFPSRLCHQCDPNCPKATRAALRILILASLFKPIKTAPPNALRTVVRLGTHMRLDHTSIAALKHNVAVTPRFKSASKQTSLDATTSVLRLALERKQFLHLVWPSTGSDLIQFSNVWWRSSSHSLCEQSTARLLCPKRTRKDAWRLLHGSSGQQ